MNEHEGMTPRLADEPEHDRGAPILARRSRAQAHRHRAKARAFRFGAACGGAPGLLHDTGNGTTHMVNTETMLEPETDQIMLVIPTMVPNPIHEYSLQDVIEAKTALFPAHPPPSRRRGQPMLMLVDTMAMDTTYSIKFSRGRHPGYVQLTPVDFKVDLDLDIVKPLPLKIALAPLPIADRPHERHTECTRYDPVDAPPGAEHDETAVEEGIFSMATAHAVPVPIVRAMWECIIHSHAFDMSPGEYINYVQDTTFEATSSDDFWDRPVPPIGYSQLVVELTKIGNPDQLHGLL